MPILGVTPRKSGFSGLAGPGGSRGVQKGPIFCLFSLTKPNIWPPQTPRTPPGTSRGLHGWIFDPFATRNSASNCEIYPPKTPPCNPGVPGGRHLPKSGKNLSNFKKFVKNCQKWPFFLKICKNPDFRHFSPSKLNIFVVKYTFSNVLIKMSKNVYFFVCKQQIHTWSWEFCKKYKFYVIFFTKNACEFAPLGL